MADALYQAKCIGACGWKRAYVREKMTYQSTFLGTLCRCKNSVFPTVMMRAVFFAGIGALAMYLYENFHSAYQHWITPNTDMHTYMSMMVAMMIIEEMMMMIDEMMVMMMVMLMVMMMID